MEREAVEPTQFDSIPRPDGPKFGAGRPKAWLATIERNKELDE
jgi:hypothetical protein